MKSTKYITSMGDLKRKDDSLCFRKSGKNIYLPVENIKEIYCLNEISLNTKLLDFISSKNIIIHFFNYYQGYTLMKLYITIISMVKMRLKKQ